MELRLNLPVLHASQVSDYLFTNREIEIKRSRFICSLARVEDADAARAAVAHARARFPDARHHCNAFVISREDSLPLLHSSDDGEPAGTAGKPMLDILTGLELIDVIAVVTRYFGGTLLGTGGLVRAYSESVREGLEGIEVMARHFLTRWQTTLPHHEAGRFMAEWASLGWQHTSHYEADGVHIEVYTNADLTQFIASRSSGTLRAEQHGQGYVEETVGAIEGGKVEYYPKSH